jgi:hypothetical protein
MAEVSISGRKAANEWNVKTRREGNSSRSRLRYGPLSRNTWRVRQAEESGERKDQAVGSCKRKMYCAAESKQVRLVLPGTVLLPAAVMSLYEWAHDRLSVLRRGSRVPARWNRQGQRAGTDDVVATRASNARVKAAGRPTCSVALGNRPISQSATEAVRLDKTTSVFVR